MSDLRERFERHQAGLLNIDYEELRDQFDRHEEIFGKRYVTFSDFEKEFELWQACWSHQQAIIDNLKAQLNNMETCYIQVKKELEDQHKKVDEVLEYLDGESANRWGLWKEKADMLDQGASNAFEEAYWMVKKTLRGAND